MVGSACANCVMRVRTGGAEQTKIRHSRLYSIQHDSGTNDNNAVVKGKGSNCSFHYPFVDQDPGSINFSTGGDILQRVTHKT